MLIDEDLLNLIDRKVIEGVKKPADPYSPGSPIQPASLDLHVGGIYLPGTSAEQAGGENHPLREFTLETGGTVLIRTVEYLSLPSHIAGFAFPPSSFAVKALLVTNAGHVDPEYKGPLRFTVINMGHESQKLSADDRVGTLVLFNTSRKPMKGWVSRTGQPGRAPNTEDLRYLSNDFAEVESRAKKIAKAEAKDITGAWDKRLAVGALWLGLIVTIIIGIIGWFTPITKLETRVDALHEDLTHAKQIEDTLKSIRSEQLEQKQKISNLSERLDRMGKSAGNK